MSAGRPLGRIALTLAMVPLLGLVGCGDDESGSGAAATTVTLEPSPLPPNDVDDLAAVFDPMLEPMGLRLTRGVLIDRSDGGYTVSDRGTHLALYAEPVDESTFTTADYVSGVYDVTAAVTPVVFDTWSDIESYDICQEPFAADQGGTEEPFPVTQVEMDRASAEAYDFDNGDLASLLGHLRSADGARLLVNQTVNRDPAYRNAVAQSTPTDGGDTNGGSDPTGD